MWNVVLIVCLASGMTVAAKAAEPQAATVVFNPETIGSAEAALWQAYYARSHQQLAVGLFDLLQAQFKLSPEAADLVSADLAEASMLFLGSTGKYKEQVLPKLIAAYRRIHDEIGAEWSPEKAAAAELKWWVARRTPGANTPGKVGKYIADSYAVIYGVSNTWTRKAGALRAKAADIRDHGGQNADWDKIEKMLIVSYKYLRKGLVD